MDDYDQRQSYSVDTNQLTRTDRGAEDTPRAWEAADDPTLARNRKQKQAPVVNYCFFICLAMNKLHFFPHHAKQVHSWHQRSGATTYAGNPC